MSNKLSNCLITVFKTFNEGKERVRKTVYNGNSLLIAVIITR